MEKISDISKKLIKSLKSSKKYSKPIINVSIGSIAISCLVMLISMSVVTGFQNEIKSKVFGFSSHIQVLKSSLVLSYESSPILKKQSFIDDIKGMSEIEHIQTFAFKPGIVQANADTIYDQEGNYKLQRDIEGVIFKGIDYDFKKDFILSKMTEGHLFDIKINEISDSVVISKYLSQKLKIKVGDKITSYFIKKDKPRPINLTVTGIYETGLEEFDKQFAFIDLKHIQKLNNWGIEAQIKLNETCFNQEFSIEAIGFGGNSNYRYKWGQESFYTESSSFKLPYLTDTTFTVIISDFDKSYSSIDPLTIPDTAKLKIITNGKRITCNNDWDIEYINDSTVKYYNDNDTIITILKTTGGSWKYYTGGFEFFINNFDNVEQVDKLINKYIDPLFKVSTIDHVYPEIFSWLEILDANVYVISLLMLMVCIVNISSLLLVIILERTNMIGVMKAFGGKNASIRKIFIQLSLYIISRGLLIGNSIALIFFIIQKNFKIIKLPQENYFLDSVPVEISIWHFAFINGLILLISILILGITSLFINKISPIKAIKFN